MNTLRHQQLRARLHPESGSIVNGEFKSFKLQDEEEAYQEEFYRECDAHERDIAEGQAELLAITVED